MSHNKRRLYTLLFVLCVIGYFWLYLTMMTGAAENKLYEFCLIKHIAGITRPSCGSTRSVVSLIKGDFVEAFMINPLGYVVALIMIVTPPWILMDVVAKKKTLFEFYQKVEIYLKNPHFAVPLIVFIALNWIWNIIKGV